MPAYEMQAYEMQAYKMQVYEMHAHPSDFSNNDLCAKYPDANSPSPELALEFAPPIHSG
jgi:hypothetical protein